MDITLENKTKTKKKKFNLTHDNVIAFFIEELEIHMVSVGFPYFLDVL